MLMPPPVPPSAEQPGWSPQWGTRNWGEIRKPVLQLALAPLLTITLMALALFAQLPRGPWNLVPMLVPLTAIALWFNRRSGILLMWPLLVIETFLAAWGFVILFRIPLD